ncbi:PREDICTED: LOW QUALITY PROTEIN: E3 ubiquitin-protein ligase TRIM39-like [Calidris pugnax]|uniref:LOW QUALITY PROTEIN: E3 ubiquitin-protein ligase TRIM39-like n=1 Tax=Calidris pugnax TaxID=198806 RepID=UPI00071DD7F6|nr:PREDICTED: LOW QUALITY PROTEIN: E3 ubiquitin-protein ligase TRIM39-like [Calidris pugnax]
MAARTPLEILRDEACCSICLEIFQDPVSISCGHSFCRSCITRTWEGRTTNFSCPQCRKTVSRKRLRPNRELANVIEAAKSLNLQPVREVEGGENLCEEHQEPLKLFCQDDKRLICVVCDRSKVHRDHFVVPMDEAAQEYKKQIETQLHLLKSEQEALQSSVKDREDRLKDHTERTEAAKQEIVRTYRKLHEFLEKQESSLLAELEQLDTEITKAHEEILQGLLEETTRLGTLIGEMERTSQQPERAPEGESPGFPTWLGRPTLSLVSSPRLSPPTHSKRDFLRVGPRYSKGRCSISLSLFFSLLQDIRITWSRGQRETLSHSLQISPELEKKFSDFTEESAAIREALVKVPGLLNLDLLLTTQMTLDPETASARLYLSEDCKLLWWKDCEQDLLFNPRRFNVFECVLGSRGFTWGCHHWDVEVHREGVWAIGVAKESVPRDCWLRLKPDEGVWALCHNKNGYVALTSPYDTLLTLRKVQKRIRICLDYEKGRVVFFYALSKEQIFAFPPASFQGERVFPWFTVKGDAQLKLLS